jgi:hypothetical protein
MLRSWSAPWWFWAVLCVAGVAQYIWIAVSHPSLFLNLDGRDFDNLWAAGRLVLAGRGADAYNMSALHAVAPYAGNYSYPPLALFVAAPFGLLPRNWSFVAWDAMSLALFAVAARPFTQGFPAWVALLSPASVVCLLFGHYGLLVGALWLLAFSGRPWAAGLLTIKPQIGGLALFRFIRSPRGLLFAGLTVGVAVAASIGLFGLAAWREFLTTTASFQMRFVLTGSTKVLTQQVTPLGGYGWIGQLLFAGAAIALLSRNFNVFTAATATFLISPYGFHYDMPVVCLGFAWTIANCSNEMSMWEKSVCVFGYLSPAIVSGGSWFVPPILLLGLVVQARRVRAGSSREDRSVGFSQGTTLFTKRKANTA